MILQSLLALADREGLVANPDYEFREVHWRLSVTPQGGFVGLESLLQESATRLRGPTVAIPRPFPGARLSGVTPDAGFLVGNASFVCGLDLSVEQTYVRRSGELIRRIDEFSRLIAEAARTTGDTGLIAVAAFLRSPAELDRARAAVSAEERAKRLQVNHLIAFRLAGDDQPFVHHRSAVVEYWSSMRARDVRAPTRQCLVTGAIGPVIDKHPPIRKLPGGTPSGVAIVSFNCPAFESYGFERNDNAPVSRCAAEGYTAALNRLLDPSVPDPENLDVQLPTQRVRLSDDTVAVFWSSRPTPVTAVIAPAVADGDPEAIRALGIDLAMAESYGVLENAAKPGASSTEPSRTADPALGREPTPQQLEDPGAFQVLVLSGGQGRATIRAFHVGRLRELVSDLRIWFRDIEISRLSGPPALSSMLRSLADRGDPKKLPPQLACDVFLAIVAGRLLPVSTLETAVRQCRRDPGDQRHARVPPERAALLKAYLNRARAHPTPAHVPYEEIRPVMNESEQNKGYLLGRLLACIERMQELAFGNADPSIANRHFAAACATPQTVFPRLLKIELLHYRKACETDRIGSARWLQEHVSGIANRLVTHENGVTEAQGFDAFLNRIAGQPIVGFPAFLPLTEQGLFILGYHQQRAEFLNREAGLRGNGTPAPTRSGYGNT
jgi:CRISPR-associated protein Csd1